MRKTMKNNNLNPSFEIDISNLPNPTTLIAVNQSINTLLPGAILKVNACNKNTIMELIHFCKISGNTLLDKITNNDEVILFIMKN